MYDCDQIGNKAAKEILGELFDIRTHEVDEIIWQRMEERALYGQEFSSSTNA